MTAGFDRCAVRPGSASVQSGFASARCRALSPAAYHHRPPSRSPLQYGVTRCRFRMFHHLLRRLTAAPHRCLYAPCRLCRAFCSGAAHRRLSAADWRYSRIPLRCDAAARRQSRCGGSVPVTRRVAHNKGGQQVNQRKEVLFRHALTRYHGADQSRAGESSLPRHAYPPFGVIKKRSQLIIKEETVVEARFVILRGIRANQRVHTATLIAGKLDFGEQHVRALLVRDGHS